MCTMTFESPKSGVTVVGSLNLHFEVLGSLFKTWTWMLLELPDTAAMIPSLEYATLLRGH
jgi:hypothetical protein